MKTKLVKVLHNSKLNSTFAHSKELINYYCTNMDEFKKIIKNSPKGWKIVFWISFALSTFLLIGGAITPPPFEIHPSMFLATGLLLAFPTLYAAYECIRLGILKGTEVSYKRGDTEITVGANLE